MSVLQEKNRNLAYVSVSLAETATKFCVFGPSTTTGGHSFCSYCGKCTWIVDVDLRRKVIRGTHITPQILIGLSAAPSLHTSLLISTPSSLGSRESHFMLRLVPLLVTDMGARN